MMFPWETRSARTGRVIGTVLLYFMWAVLLASIPLAIWSLG